MNVKAYWMEDTKNWGDIFTPFLLKEGFGVDAEWAPVEQAELFCCGSLLERVPDGFTGHILGTGMGHEETRRDLSQVKFPRLVRGILSAQRACMLGGETYVGDPGLLAYMFVTAGVRKRHRFGIVPHHFDRNHPQVVEWYDRALVIDIESGVREVIDAIASCEVIVSSSLHGIVIADSLGIPSKFVKLTEDMPGNCFKVHDYFSAYGEKMEPASDIENAFDSCDLRDTAKLVPHVKKLFKEFAGL